MRFLLVACLSALGAATCQRVEEPAPSEPPIDAPPVRDSTPAAASRGATRSAPVAPPASGAAGSPLAAPCVTPLTEPPPPRAKPATRCPKDPEAPTAALPTGRVTFPDAPGAPSIEVEVARGHAALQRGLMYRTSLGAERGMLFDFGEEEPRTFWMKNTCVPLDMLFLSRDGTVAGILEEVPVLNEAPRGVPCPAAYVLEVNAGYARRGGIKPGMKASIDPGPSNP